MAPPLPDEYRADRMWSLINHDVDWYREQGYDYIVVSEVLRTYPSRTVDEEARYAAFLADEHLDLAAEIRGPLQSYPGFRVWVFRVER